MKIANIKVEDLKPATYNPRTIDKKNKEDLTKSIQDFGLLDPLIINKHKGREGIIIGGHQRYTIACELGMKTVPCIEVDLTEDRERELNIRLNKNTGRWDFKLLKEFPDTKLMDWGFEPLEFPEPAAKVEKAKPTNGTLPIVPAFNEKHQAVVIVAHNEIDINFLKTVLNLDKRQSYKSVATGQTWIITVEDFRKIYET